MARLRTIDFIAVPPRGAPLVTLLVQMTVASGLVAGSVTDDGAWIDFLLFVFFVTLLISPSWMRLLAERSWPQSPPQPRWFGTAVRWFATLAVIGTLVASTSSMTELTWTLFAIQCVLTVVVTPIELRRYPGFLPRDTG